MNHQVDIVCDSYGRYGQKNYSCSHFDIYGILWSHVMVTIGYKNINSYLFCEEYYTTETYRTVYNNKIFFTKIK